MSVVDEVKDRLDIVDVVSEYVPLKKAGRNFKALCPFHTEKTPSFIVFPDGQRWHCFGACSTGGDVFTFIQKIENVDFPQALRMLAGRAGVELAPRSKEAAAEEEARERLRAVNAAAAVYFNHLLRTAPAAQVARDYVARRGVNAESIETFQLGYAPDSWDALNTHLTRQGHKLEDIYAAGLIIERESGGYYDRFRHRLMFPIRDVRGRVIGFGGRALSAPDDGGEGQPKYLNSPQTPVFDKSKALYGLDVARRAIRRQGIAILVEGYMDVVSAHQHGFKNVVASLGTALTESQLKLAKRFTRTFVLALDADVAGSEATLRGLDVAKAALDREVVPVPTWRGLIRYESRLDAELRILVLPPGRDPDQVIQADPERWRRLVGEALPVMDYYFDALTQGLDLQSAKGKAEAARRLLPVIREIGDQVEQTHYLQRLARLVRVDERTLWDQLRGRRPPRRAPARLEPQSRPGPRETPEPRQFGLEAYLLTCFLRIPSLLERLDSSLTEVGTRPLGGEDFEDAQNRAVFELLQDCLATGAPADLETLTGAVDESLQTHLAFLVAQAEAQPPLADDQWKREALVSALRLRLRNLHKRMEGIRFLLDEAEASRDPEAVTLHRQTVTELTHQIERLDSALTSREMSTFLAGVAAVRASASSFAPRPDRIGG